MGQKVRYMEPIITQRTQNRLRLEDTQPETKKMRKTKNQEQSGGDIL
jgi:hypothetical protein